MNIWIWLLFHVYEWWPVTCSSVCLISLSLLVWRGFSCLMWWLPRDCSSHNCCIIVLLVCFFSCVQLALLASDDLKSKFLKLFQYFTCFYVFTRAIIFSCHPSVTPCLLCPSACIGFWCSYYQVNILQLIARFSYREEHKHQMTWETFDIGINMFVVLTFSIRNLYSLV